MGRHTENARDLVELELPCFQELRLFRDAMVLRHALLKHTTL